VSEGELDFEDRIIVRDTPRTREHGTVGWLGTIVGKSYEGDVPGNPVVGYAVALDNDGGLTRSVDLDEVERAPYFAKPS
jgi:hypothetical protein